MQNRLIILQEMKKENPSDPFYKYAIALELVKNDVVLAQKEFEETILSHSEYLPTYFQLGKLYAEQGNFERAISIFKQGITLAQAQQELHTLKELKAALFELEDD